MIRGYHAVFTPYGFWLPNEPRGSGSDFIRSWELLRFGKATKVDTRRSVAGASHNLRQREAAKAALKYPPVLFTGEQALSIAWGFDDAIKRSGYVLHACSIMPDHVHIVVAPHRHRVETIVGQLKGAATKRLTRDGLHPFAHCRTKTGELPTPWVRKGWRVYLNEVADVRRAICYVQANPIREGKRRQSWPFVVAYEV